MKKHKIIFKKIKKTCKVCFSGTNECLNVHLESDHVSFVMRCSKCKSTSSVCEKIGQCKGSLKIYLLCVDSKKHINYWLISYGKEKYLLESPKASIPKLTKIPFEIRDTISRTIGSFFDCL